MNFSYKIGTIFTFTFVLLTLIQSSAQTCEFINADFGKEKIEWPEDVKENELVLFKEEKIEIVSREESSSQYRLLHEQILLNSDDAIERNNRVYIPLGFNEKLLTNKLRVLYKDGRINELHESDIKEEIDEENKSKYNYYAVNGLEKGAIIDKLFLIEEEPNLDGQIIKVQDTRAIKDFSFELIYPDKLEFISKSYNGLDSAVITPEAYKEKTSQKITAHNIPSLPLGDERYSNLASNTMMLRYKLYANNWSGAKNINNYKEFAGNVFNVLNVELTEKEIKTLTEFAKTIKKSDNVDDMVSSIENKIKSTIAYNVSYQGNKTFLDAIKNKIANNLQTIQLYTSLFNYFEIESEVVMTSKRFTLFFDKDFESMDQLSDIIFYIPKANKYLDPQSLDYRFPLFNFNYGNAYGLFIRGKEFGGVKMGLGEVRFIELPSQDITHDITDIEIDFTNDIENPIIHTTHQHGGYSAAAYQVIKDYLPQDRYEEVLKEIAENFTQKSEYKELKTQFDGSENIGKKPFIIDLTFEGKNLVQKAGDNILCNVGTLIGSQMEMYQEDKRVLPVETLYPHSYNRNIKIKLPDGYSIKNPEDFDMEYSANLDGKKVAFWTSKATVSDHEVVVNNREEYSVVNYPLAIFEQYKEVVNAAADFNKIVIVIGKK